jgi:DNA-binding IclR family transcriptional regulator
MDAYTKEVLRFIAAQPNGVTFHQLVRGYGFPDAPISLPNLLRALVDGGFVENLSIENDVNTRYRVTPEGSQKSRG